MRSSLVMLAGLASSALAYPTDRAVEARNLDLLGELLGDLTLDVTGILSTVLEGTSVEIFAGLSAQGAAALSGGALGCKAGAIHAKAKAALKVWLRLHAEIDTTLKTSLIAWCDGHDELVLSADVLAALSVYIPGSANIAAKGQLYVTIDGIFEAASLESALVLSVAAQTSLSAWVEAKVDLDVDIKVGLNVCAAGGIVGSLSADIKASLLAWLNSTECELSADLKVSVLAWINGRAGGELVEIGALADTALSTVSVGASVGIHVLESGLLSVGGQASLAAFLGVDLAVALGADVKLALEACAKGELATAVELDVRTKLAIWLASSDCSLGVELKAVVLLWLSFAVEADVSVALNLVDGVLGDVTGLLTDIVDDLSVDLRGALSLCAAGGSLLDLTFSARTELAAFLSGCTSLNIDVSIQIIIIEWFTGCSIPGAPAATASSSVLSLPSSTPYLASTSSVPSGASASVGLTVSASVPAASGSVSVPSGSDATSTPCATETSEIVSSTVIPNPSGSGSLTASIPAIATGTVPAVVPTGASPTGTTVSGSVPAGSATTGTATTVVIPGSSGSSATTVTIPVTVTGTAPSGSATTIVVPNPSGTSSLTVTIPAQATGVSPTGTTVVGGSVPSGSAPSASTTTVVIPGSSGSSSTTITVTVPAEATSTAPSGSATTIVVPHPSGTGSLTVTVPAQATGTAATTGASGVTASAPAPTSPATIPSGGSTGSNVTETVTVTATLPSGGNTGSGKATETVTVTATVCGCE
ncbi:hypothetical protein DTO012A7_5429 [Penicillium roqueforti]|uniref:Genomic scaffold, ProqFM164S02 n=1 Tax=Penicillium roqueforti (strain FM164) TaxID=1365484 RepID=W6Q683_PENRF|nr:hypothetical protein CBS147338_51 [Penicillium roqueforti]KAI3191392.1 hypothetical protein DTO032C6_1122 [Penicillium roqueforti]KAI3231818.1 hypothetical protein DTO012A7_5429 [Penicillium roqueforti]CDM32223.1 unnamed protein product [Penicillium roqueforti FM164]